MPHGLPDYGLISARKTVYPMVDLGEAVARLGSIDTFDRRGDVIWLDDFEADDDKWEVYKYGDGALGEVSSLRARSGQFSMKLRTGKDGAQGINAMRRFPYPVLSKTGVEFHFTVDPNTAYIYLLFELYDGTYRTVYGIRYDKGANLLAYCSGPDVYTPFATGVNLYHNVYLFVAFKLVVDLEGGKYVRLIVNNTTYDMSAYSPDKRGDTTTIPHLALAMEHFTGAEANVDIWADDVIITQNEP